jgi:hypothetical protein
VNNIKKLVRIGHFGFTETDITETDITETFHLSVSLKNLKLWSDSDHLLLIYFSLSICAQFELSKNLIGLIVFKS